MLLSWCLVFASLCVCVIVVCMYAYLHVSEEWGECLLDPPTTTRLTSKAHITITTHSIRDSPFTIDKIDVCLWSYRARLLYSCASRVGGGWAVRAWLYRLMA